MCSPERLLGWCHLLLQTLNHKLLQWPGPFLSLKSGLNYKHVTPINPEVNISYNDNVKKQSCLSQK